MLDVLAIREHPYGCDAMCLGMYRSTGAFLLNLAVLQEAAVHAATTVPRTEDQEWIPAMCLGNCRECYDYILEKPPYLDACDVPLTQVRLFVEDPRVCALAEMYPVSLDYHVFSLASLGGGAQRLQFPSAQIQAEATESACKVLQITAARFLSFPSQSSMRSITRHALDNIERQLAETQNKLKTVLTGPEANDVEIAWQVGGNIVAEVAVQHVRYIEQHLMQEMETYTDEPETLALEQPHQTIGKVDKAHGVAEVGRVVEVDGELRLCPPRPPVHGRLGIARNTLTDRGHSKHMVAIKQFLSGNMSIESWRRSRGHAIEMSLFLSRQARLLMDHVRTSLGLKEMFLEVAGSVPVPPTQLPAFKFHPEIYGRHWDVLNFLVENDWVRSWHPGKTTANANEDGLVYMRPVPGAPASWQRPLQVVEIGVACGQNGIELLRKYPYLSYIGIDPTITAVVRNEFELFGERAQLYANRSDEIASVLEDESIDLLFVDGPHTYRQVRGDLELYSPKVRRGGIISGHDFTCGHPPLLWAVTERRLLDNQWHGLDNEVHFATDGVYWWPKT